ncbi:MAG TPA: putative toxin-antitoxin system toxin component, PIN family [Thermoanaerobaculia bacterium]
MTDRLRAVLDTNVIVSAFLSRNPSSPTQELLRRWRDGEFVLVVSEELLREIIEKLLEKRVDPGRVREFSMLLARLAERVDVAPGAVEPVIIDDLDDNHVVACAVEGNADYLVTYDPHFDRLGSEYRGIRIAKALPFLWAVRGDVPPNGAPGSPGSEQT